MSQSSSNPQPQSSSSSESTLPQRWALIFQIAAFIGLIAGALTYAGMERPSLAGALLASMSAAGVALPVVNKLIA
ncbi:hypothetical protein GCM10009759_79440 [Kitasatospora saccharophila]|uniref:Uncharacterized protein n=1 Tax=Kitasatospora saccharophila TaxID=407973 RepID=A0ABP5K9Q0_9ACTN